MPPAVMADYVDASIMLRQTGVGHRPPVGSGRRGSRGST